MAPTLLTAIMAAQALPASGDGAAPDWVHLLPGGQAIMPQDGRGPYTVADVDALLHASFASGEPLLIDQDHATDLAAPKGEPAPARGWIVELASREDGLWGRVEWTPEGRALVEGRAYRGLSPVFLHSKDNRVLRLLRASLTNTPNLRGLTALHSEGQDGMNEVLARLKEMLGLGPDAEEHEIWNALSAVMTVATAEKARMGAEATALQSALGAIGTALGVEGEADQAAIVTAAKVAKAGTADVLALQSENAGLKAQLQALTAGQAQSASEVYVDAEMAKGRVGLNATTRGDLVALHMSQPDTAKRIIEAMPIVGPGAAQPKRQLSAKADGTVALNAEQLNTARLLGITPDAYAKALKEEAA